MHFVPYGNNPLFACTDSSTWDREIRKRGYILRHNDTYHLWYTGYYYDDSTDTRLLGYATLMDGYKWIRYPGNPVFSESWVEDMQVVISEGNVPSSVSG